MSYRNEMHGIDSDGEWKSNLVERTAQEVNLAEKIDPGLSSLARLTEVEYAPDGESVDEWYTRQQEKLASVQRELQQKIDELADLQQRVDRSYKLRKSHEESQEVLEAHLTGLAQRHGGSRVAEAAAHLFGKSYPHQDGDHLVLGPEAFTGKNNHDVIFWRGRRFVAEDGNKTVSEVPNG